MPNNKQQAVKRLMGLKRRFIRDNKFFLDYKKYMNDLLEKGYARRCNETPTGKTWNIPHHAVYQFCLIVVLNLREVNKQRATTRSRQIVSILIRFCEERVAVKADVELKYRSQKIDTHKNLLCVHICLVVLLLEVVPIIIYVEQQ